MPKRKRQDFPTPEENPRFHDTYQFLRRYRDATYSLKVVVHQMENQFKVQYGSSIDEFERHRSSTLHGIFIAAGRAEPAVAAKGNKL